MWNFNKNTNFFVWKKLATEYIGEKKYSIESFTKTPTVNLWNSFHFIICFNSNGGVLLKSRLNWPTKLICPVIVGKIRFKSSSGIVCMSGIIFSSESAFQRIIAFWTTVKNQNISSWSSIVFSRDLRCGLRDSMLPHRGRLAKGVFSCPGMAGRKHQRHAKTYCQNFYCLPEAPFAAWMDAAPFDWWAWPWRIPS